MRSHGCQHIEENFPVLISGLHGDQATPTRTLCAYLIPSTFVDHSVMSGT